MSLRDTRAPRHPAGICRAYLPCNAPSNAIDGVYDCRFRKVHTDGSDTRFGVRFDITWTALSDSIKTELRRRSTRGKVHTFLQTANSKRYTKAKMLTERMLCVKSSCRFVRTVADGKGWTVLRDIKSFLPRSRPLCAVRILGSLFFLGRDKPERRTPKPIVHFTDTRSGIRFTVRVEIGVWKKKDCAKKLVSKVNTQTDVNQQQPKVMRATATKCS